MFSKLTGKAAQPAGGKDEDASLDKVLPTPQAKLEFILLIMLCTDRMRQDIDAIFDPSITTSQSNTPSAPSPWEGLRDAASDKPPTYENATKDLGRDDYFRRKRDLNGAGMLELKKSAGQAFAKWRVQVLKRAGEVLKVRADAAKAEMERRRAAGGAQGNDLIDLGDQKDSEPGQTGDQRHPRIATSLSNLGEKDRILLLDSLLLFLLSLEHYSAYSRLLVLFVASSLNLPATLATEQEDKVAHGLLKGAKAQMNAEESRKRENNKSATDRAWKVGLATVAGAAVIGLTGGLAAPFLAGALGSVLGGIGLGGTAIAGLLGGLAGNFVVVGALFGAYGGSMTGKMMDKYAKEVEDFAFIPLRRVEEDQHRLRVAIGISGWLSSKEDRYQPWLVLGDRIECFCLQWELEVLLKLGGSLLKTFKELAVRVAAVEIIKRTVFAGLMVALWPLGLLRFGQMLSNSFSVAQARADKAGEVLADALIHKVQGERPVTLVGYSLGARVIYSCLQTLAKRKAFGLVESVYLMGLPASAESQNWRTVRAVVADRVVNVYSRNDYVLGLVYRTSSITPNVAGLEPIAEVAGIENVDLSELVSGHLRYRYLVGAILKHVGYESLDSEQLEREHIALKKLDAEEEKLKKEQEEKETKEARPKGQRSSSFDWNTMAQNDQDANNLNEEEIEERLRQMDLEDDLDSSKSTRAEAVNPSANVKTGKPLDAAPSDPKESHAHRSEEKGPASESAPSLPPRPKEKASHDEELPPWKPHAEHQESKAGSREQMQMLQPDAEGTDEEDIVRHRIAMVDDEHAT